MPFIFGSMCHYLSLRTTPPPSCLSCQQILSSMSSFSHRLLCLHRISPLFFNMLFIFFFPKAGLTKWKSVSCRRGQSATVGLSRTLVRARSPQLRMQSRAVGPDANIASKPLTTVKSTVNGTKVALQRREEFICVSLEITKSANIQV